MLEAGQTARDPKLFEAFSKRQPVRHVKPILFFPPAPPSCKYSERKQWTGFAVNQVHGVVLAWSMWRNDSRTASEERVWMPFDSGISSRRAAQVVEFRGLAFGAWLREFRWSLARGSRDDP